MTDEEIEKALKDLTSIDLSDESNYDSCGRIIAPRGMSVIYEALDYINRLKAEKAQVRKDTAKEILDDLLENFMELIARRINDDIYRSERNAFGYARG